MIRFGKALLLIALSGILWNCSSRPEVIRTEVRQRPSIKDGAVSEPSVAQRRIEPAALNNLGDITGSIDRSGRPWPKRGTPEWSQLEAEEIAREQRIKEVLSSICRGC